MTTAYIGVGTNIEKEKHARIAVEELKELDGGVRVSPVYECAPVGFSGAAFFNFVVVLETEMELTEFSHRLRKIEVKWGRQNDAQKYQDRKLDLDILLFGESVSAQAPVLPRKDIYKYPFVIQPLYDLSPDLIIPGDGRKVSEVWGTAEDLDLLTKVSVCF